MSTFKGVTVSNEYNGSKIRSWDITGAREVDDIFGPYQPYQLAMLGTQEDYLRGLDVPFITTCQNNQYTIWKEKRAEHVR